ncbi:MAG: hypothetical protein ABI237_01935 [Ginsengibacter sp.]
MVKATFIGTDEPSSKVNGQNDWMWTWQNDDLTFIVHSDNRGFKTIEDTFSNGFPMLFYNMTAIFATSIQRLSDAMPNIIKLVQLIYFVI